MTKLLITKEIEQGLIEQLLDQYYKEEYDDEVVSPESNYTVKGSIVNGELVLSIISIA